MVVLPSAQAAWEAIDMGQSAAFQIGLCAVSLIMMPINVLTGGAGSSTVMKGVEQVLKIGAKEAAKRIAISMAVGAGVGFTAGGLYGVLFKDGKWSWSGAWSGAIAGGFTGLSLGLSWSAAGEVLARDFIPKVIIGEGGLVKKCLNVAERLIDLDITVNVSHSLYDSLRTGDGKGVMGSLAVLTSLNLINPLMNIGKTAQEAERSAQLAASGKVEQELTNREKILNPIKDTLAPMVGFSDGHFSGKVLAQTWGSAGLGGLAGYGVVSLTNATGLTDDLNPWIGAGLGAAGGIGISNASLLGSYSKETLTTLLSNLNPVTLYNRSFEMINRIEAFNLRFSYGMAMTNQATGGWLLNNLGGGVSERDASGKVIGEPTLLDKIDDFSGLHFFSSAKQLSDSAVGFGLYNTAEVKKSGENFEQMISTPNMWVFSLATGVAQPILGPALLNMPGVGTAMQYMNTIADLMPNETLQTGWEEGVKEQLAGKGLTLLGIDGQAAEVIQELFDGDGVNMTDSFDFLSSTQTDSATVDNVISEISRAANTRNNTDAVFERTVNQQLARVGINTDTFQRNSYGDIAGRTGSDGTTNTGSVFYHGMSHDAVRTAVVAEIALNAASNNGFRTANTQSARQVLQQTINRDGISGLNTARQLNFAYGNAVAVNLGVVNSQNVDTISNQEIAERILSTGVQENTTEQAVDGQSNTQPIVDTTARLRAVANLADGVANRRSGFMDYFSGKTAVGTGVMNVFANALNQQTEIVTDANSGASRQALANTVALNGFAQSLMGGIRGNTGNISDILAENNTALQNKTDVNFAQTINDQLREASEKRELTSSEQKLLDLSQQVIDGRMNALDFRLITNTNNSQYFVQTNRQQRQSLDGIRQDLRDSFGTDYVQSLAQARETLEEMNNSNYVLANSQNKGVKTALRNLKLSLFEYSTFGNNLLSSSLFSGNTTSINSLSPLQQIQQLHNYDNIEEQIKFDWQKADTTQLQNNNLIQARQQLDNVKTQANALENETLKDKINGIFENRNIENMTFEEIVQTINDIKALVSENTSEEKFNNELLTATERLNYLGKMQAIYTQMSDLQQMLNSNADLDVKSYRQQLEKLSQQVKNLLSNGISEQAKTTLEKVDVNSLLNYISSMTNGIVNNRISEQIVNKINEQLKTETDAKKRAELQNISDIFKLLSNNDYSDPVKMQELNKEAMVKISTLFESYYNNYWAGLDLAIDGYIQQYLSANKEKVLRDIDISLQALDEEYNTDKARESKDYQDAKENLEKAKANIENYSNLEEGDLKTKVTGIIIKSMNFSQTQELRNVMAQSIRTGANESDLSFAEELALTLKLGEISYGIFDGITSSNTPAFKSNNTRDEKGVVSSGEELRADNIMDVDFGNGILSQSATRGKSTVKQVLMLCENLLGRVSALSAGGGKSFVFAWTMNMYFHTTGEAGVAEFLAAKPGDAAQFISNTHAENPILLKSLGLEKVDGNAYYGNNDFKGLAEQYTNEIADGAKGRLVAYATGTRGFVELQARVGEGQDSKTLNDALNNVSMRVADEADVAALSRVAFILGSGNDTVPLDVAKKSVSMLQFLQGINTEAVVDATDLAGMQFTMKDGKVICSSQLQKLIDNTYTSENDKALISNVMRAMYQMARKAAGQESVAFVNGQPASIEAGTLQENTTDQSNAYNVALVALQIQNQMQLDGKSIDNMKFKDFKYGEYDDTKVKMSISSGESTLSQIFSRGQASTLNCGGSATLDVAREVAHTIFGGQAIDIEASSIEATKVQLKERFKVFNTDASGAGLTRESIIAQNTANAVEFLKNGKTSGKETVGLLFGAMDMSYNLDVMVRALAELSQETNNKFTYKQIMDATNGYTMTEVLQYISDNYSEMKKYTSKIQVVDSEVAGTNADEIQKMTQNKGKLTFSNENALRGINWQSIDLILLDGQNFPSSELLQAIGRAGRNKEYGKDKCSVTIYTIESSLEDTIQEMRAIDQWYKQNQTGKSNLFDGLGAETAQRYQDLLYSDNISAVDLLEIVSVYKSMQLKSESIMFKANQEAMYILVKEALAEAATKAQQEGNIKDYEFLHALYLEVISHDESNLFGSFANTTDMDNYSNPIESVRQTYLNALDKAIEYLGRAAEGVSDKMLKFQFELRLQDAQTAKNNDIFGMLNNSSEMEASQGFFNSTFAGATRDVDPMFGVSPATDIAKTLLKLAGNVLPTASANAQAQQQVTVNQAIAQNSSLSEQEQEYLRSDEAVERGYVYTNEDGVKVLSNKGDMLIKTLTGDDDWYKFFAWLFGILGINFDKSADVFGKADAVDSIWNKGYTDMTKLERFKERMSLIDKETHFNEEDFKQMYTFTYPAGLSSFGLTIPSDSIAFANRVEGTTSDNDYFRSIREQYADIEEEYQKFVDSQGSNKLALGKIQKLVTALQNTVNSTIESLTPIAQMPQLQEQLTEARYYNQQADVIETENSLANISAEIKAAMAQAGIPITEKTDTAIANMQAYLGKLSPEEAKAVRKELRLSDINRFADMPTLIYDLAQKGTITLSDKETYVLKGLIGKDSRTGRVSTVNNGDVRIGNIRNLMEQTRGTEERPIDLTLPTDEEILEIAARMTYPTQDPKVFADRYNFVINNVEFDVIDRMSLSVIANGDNFVTNGDDKVVSTWKGFEEEYERLLKATTIGDILDMEAEEIKYRDRDDIINTYGENKYNAMSSAYNRFERKVGRDRVREIMASPYSDAVKKSEREAYEKYLQQITAQGVEDSQSMAQRLAYRKTTTGNSFNRDFERRGIDYGAAKDNYNSLLEFFEGKGIPTEEAEKLARSFTLEELNSDSIRIQLNNLIDKGLIKINTNTNRRTIISAIQEITNEQLRKAQLGIKDISSLLTMAGLDSEQIEKNDVAITLWMARNKIVKKYGEKIIFEYEVKMKDLSDAKYVGKVLNKTTYTEELIRHFKEMTYNDYMKTDVSYALNLREKRDFFKMLGFDYDKIMEAYNEIREKIKAEKLGDKAIEEFVGRATLEQLSDSKYVEGIEILIDRGVITAEDIVSGKEIGTIITENKIGEVRAALGEEYSTAMTAFGLENIVENTKKLEEKYTSDAERAVISEMSISELTDVEQLISSEDKMKARVTSFGDTLTMNKAQEIATREEGLDIAGIINGATRYLGYALYDKRAEELKKEGIDVNDVAIKEIIDNENIVEEVKGLKALGFDDKDIKEMVKEAGKAKKTIRETIQGKSIREFEDMTSGMSEDQIDRLYKYLGLDRKAVEKKIREIKNRIGVPEELAIEKLTIGEISRNKDIKGLASKADKRVETANYKRFTIDEYLGLSEQERARYGADQVKIDARVRELTSGEDAILKGYIVGDMSVRDILGEGVAEKKINRIMNSKVERNKYYNKMSGEDFMRATEVTRGERVDKRKTEEKRTEILGDNYATFMKNYYSLSRATSFGEVVKKVSVEVLSSDRAKKSIEAVVGDGKLTEEQVTKIVLVIEESKEEDRRDREVLGEKIKPVLEELQSTAGAEVMDCVEVAAETMGKIIPLRSLTEAALRANPYAQDKLKAAGVSEGLEGTELGQLRKKTGLSYGTIKERTIDLAKVDPKGISEETPLVLYMKEKGHTFVITEISDGLVVYTRVDSEGKETEEIKETEEFKEEEGTQGIMLSQLTTPFIAYMEKEGSDIGHVVTITEMASGYVTYTGTDKAGNKIVETTTVEEFFKEEGFSGLILTQKGQKEVTYLDSGVKEVVGEMFNNLKSNRYEAGKEMLEKIIDGVTAPGELNKALKYVLSIWNKDVASMLEYIGLDDSALGNKEAIVQGATRKITETVELGKEGKLSDAEVRVEIELVTTLRDLLITTGTDKDWLKNANEDQIMAKLIVSKAVNQNVIVNMFEEGVKASVSKASDGDFVIDVKKLQNTIVDKNIKFAKDAKIEDVMELLAGADKKYRTPMMSFNMRNIHAIAASA